MVLEGAERRQGRAPGDRRDQSAGGRARARSAATSRSRSGRNMVHGSDSPESAAREVGAVLPRAWQLVSAPARAAQVRPLVLASRSPQRRAILERLGVAFTVRVSGVRASSSRASRGEVALENALRKARAVRAPGAREAVLGGDTLVSLDGRSTASRATRRRRARRCSALGGAHARVISGLALLLADERRASARRVARTRVTLPARSTRSCSTGTSRPGVARTRRAATRSRAPARRSCGAIDGDYENVVGLPVATLLRRSARSCSRSPAPSAARGAGRPLGARECALLRNRWRATDARGRPLDCAARRAPDRRWSPERAACRRRACASERATSLLRWASSAT